jgi:regulator of sirC expression with transglutaminase-like and TPR domain
MSSTIADKLTASLTQKQRAALVTLLTDDDPAVYRSVREKILSYGQSAEAWLRPHTLSSDPVLRRHAIEIIQHLAQQAADDAFLGFCLKNHGDNLDLEPALWLLAQTRYPDINIEAYRAMLDDYANELRERIAPGAKPKPMLTAINQFLFEELGFRGDEKNYYDPDNSYLNRVMDRRQGNPISLCLVYLLVAWRLKLPVVGIGLPGHFLARYQNSATEIYIDAFYRGRFLTKNDCIHHLVRGNFPLDDNHFSPASPHRILMRICANLYQSYQNLKRAEATARFQRYIIALAR